MLIETINLADVEDAGAVFMRPYLAFHLAAGTESRVPHVQQCDHVPSVAHALSPNSAKYCIKDPKSIK